MAAVTAHRGGYFYPPVVDLDLTPELGVKCQTCAAPPMAACRQAQTRGGFYVCRAHRSRLTATPKAGK